MHSGTNFRTNLIDILKAQFYKYIHTNERTAHEYRINLIILKYELVIWLIHAFI